MNVTVDVQGQKLRVLQNKKEFVAGSQKFVRFQFTLDEDWDKLMKFASFDRTESPIIPTWMRKTVPIFLLRLEKAPVR